MIRSKCGSV